MKSIKTLIVICVYNHANTLRKVVLKSLEQGLEVLVVDDGSNDNPYEQIKDLKCYYIRHEKNKGKGAAILTAANWAEKKGFVAILTIDADGQMDPSYAKTFIELASNNWPCIVVGNRILDPEVVPKSSIIGRSISNFWIRLECGLEAIDTQSGFRLYPVFIFKKLSFLSQRYAFEVEVITKSVWAGLDIIGFPIEVYYPPDDERISHFNKIKDNIRISLLHTYLILRALVPWPYKKIIQREKDKLDKISIWHPIKLLNRLCKEHASPFLLAVAVWVGLFMGALPLIACHTIAIIYVTHKLHLNKIAAVAASQFCTPPVVPLLCIETGHFIRYKKFLLHLSWNTAIVQAPQRIWEWFLGSLVIGPILGIIGGSITYFSIRWLRTKRKKRLSIKT